MFEQASRTKLRFMTVKGAITVEDLWDLPLTGKGVCLDELEKAANRAVKADVEESYVAKKSTLNASDGLRLNILRHIIDYRLAQKERQAKQMENKAKKQKILAMIADKEDGALMDKSTDELKAMLDEL